MINRELIRLKVVQLVYAYYQNEGRSLDVVLKELDFSMNKAYELYLFLITFLVQIRELAQHHVDFLRQQHERKGIVIDSDSPEWRIAENPLLKMLGENETIISYRENRKQEWEGEDALVRTILKQFVDGEVMQTYLRKNCFIFENERELVRKLYKTYIFRNEDFDALIEEHGLYWNDDKDTIDSFVIKTIKRYDPQGGAEQPLLPAFSSEDDVEFARTLLAETINRSDETRNLIRENCKNWEFNRLALMDLVIMQIALTEIVTFSNIPLSVTFNEYLEITKVYSTPKSSGYVNGLLDHIVRKLKEENVIMKN